MADKKILSVEQRVSAESVEQTVSAESKGTGSTSAGEPMAVETQHNERKRKFAYLVIDINNLNREEFMKLFGNIVECFPKIALDLYSKKPFDNFDGVVTDAQNLLEHLDITEKETVLKLHPDLAGKLADDGKLTIESTHEQKAAGLDKLTVDQKKELNNLNEKYKEKFGFPFVICARENKAEAILKGLNERLNNNKDQEIKTGINEVKKICKLRLLDIIIKN